ncbi:unnamed protein product [Lathyrus sativus]|nr:unnamed protein product [Lathyrus sativus]
MASEQVHRGEVFSETFVEIGEIQIQEQRNEGEGGNNQKQQDIGELHGDRGKSQDKAVERKRREKAAKGKKQDQKEGKTKPVVVCETVVKVLPQKDNESSNEGSFERVQEREKAKKQGVLGETKTQHSEKMNKNRENNVLATYAEVVKGDDSAARRVQEQKLNDTILEKGFERKTQESQVGVMQNLHTVKEKLEVTVTDSAASRVQEQELDETIVGKGFEEEKQESHEGIVQNLHMVNEPLNNKVSEGGSTVLGAVGETVLEIGENMLKPAKKVIEKSEEGKEGGGVLSAIGETVAEIAETTKVIAVGDGESESK